MALLEMIARFRRGDIDAWLSIRLAGITTNA
jgi:hypothetical protein